MVRRRMNVIMEVSQCFRWICLAQGAVVRGLAALRPPPTHPEPAPRPFVGVHHPQATAIGGNGPQSRHTALAHTFRQSAVGGGGGEGGEGGGGAPPPRRNVSNAQHIEELLGNCPLSTWKFHANPPGRGGKGGRRRQEVNSWRFKGAFVVLGTSSARRQRDAASRGKGFAGGAMGRASALPSPPHRVKDGRGCTNDTQGVGEEGVGRVSDQGRGRVTGQWHIQSTTMRPVRSFACCVTKAGGSGGAARACALAGARTYLPPLRPKGLA